MKQKKSWFLLLAIIQLLCNSIQAQMNRNLKDYYSLVNKAELSIVDSNYKKASLYYDSAFVKFPQGFAVDFYNASVCEALLKNYTNCYKKLKTVLQRGYSLEKAKSNTALTDFFNKKSGKKLIKECGKTNFYTYDKKLRFSLDSIRNADQLFRVKEGSYQIYGDTISKIDKSNVAWFNNYIEHHGFPAEVQTGILPNTFDFPYSIVIVHQHLGAQYRVFDYSDALLKAIVGGKIHADIGAGYIDESAGKDTYGRYSCALNKIVLDTNDSRDLTLQNKVKWRFNNLPEEYQTETTMNRQSIGLESVANYRKKLAFNLKNNQFELCSISRSVHYLLMKSDYDAWIKNTVIVE